MHLINLTEQQIIDRLIENNSEVVGVLAHVREQVPYYKRQIQEYQGGVLYVLSKQFNHESAYILEIGTAWGYSAACIANAAPDARIITLNPKEREVPVARKNLEGYPNVTVVKKTSKRFLLTRCRGCFYHMIFVDGDHARVRDDFPYWNLLYPGGLMLHHDYSPDGTWRPCRPVYEAVNEFAEWLGREPDVLVTDDRGIGMAGFYKQIDDPIWGNGDA